MARVIQTKLQKEADKKKTKAVVSKAEPYRVRLKKLTVKQTKKIIDKVVFEYDGIIAEKKNETKGLQISDSVDNRLKESQKAYDGKVDYTDFPYPDCANVAGTIIPSAVDGARAQTMRAFKVDPPFKVMNEPDTDITNQKEHFLQDNVRDKIPNAHTEFSAWFNTAWLKGVGVIKHYWKVEKKTKKERVTYSNFDDFNKVHDEKDYPAFAAKLRKGKEVTLVESEEVEFAGNVIEWITSENFLVREKVKDVNKANFVGDIKEYTAEEILEQDFDNIDELLSDDEIEKVDTNRRTFKTVHCELRIDLYGRKEKLFFVVEIEKKVLLLAERLFDHGHSMYIPMFISPYEGTFWRQGFYDKLISLHGTHKNIIDIILNSAYITFIPSFKALNKGSFDPQSQDWYPGVVWWLDKMDDVVQWDVRPSQMPFSEWAEKIQNLSFERSGISPYTQGTPMSAQESGKKVQTLLAAGGMRLEENISYIKEALNELAWQIMELHKQMGKGKQVIFMKGKKKELSPNIFKGTDGSYVSTFDHSRMNPDAILERNLLVLGTEEKNPLVQGNLDAVRELHYQVIKSAGMGWEDRVDKILPTMDELYKKQVEIQKQAIRELYMSGEFNQALTGQEAPPAAQQGGAAPPLGVV